MISSINQTILLNNDNAKYKRVPPPLFQGDRGFDGLPGLPGIQGHRVKETKNQNLIGMTAVTDLMAAGTDALKQ